jgi:chromosome segregation ATPase
MLEKQTMQQVMHGQTLGEFCSTLFLDALQELRAQHEALQAQLTDLEQHFSTVEQQAQSYKQELQACQAELQHAQEAQAASGAAQQLLRETQQQLAVAEQQLQAATDEAKALQQQLAASESTAAAKDERIKELRTALGEVMESKEVCRISWSFPVPKLRRWGSTVLGAFSGVSSFGLARCISLLLRLYELLLACRQ